MGRQDWKGARLIFEAILDADPNDGYAAFQLGSACIRDRDPESLRSGMFYYARAAVLMREESLRTWVKRQYSIVNGTPLGLDAYWDFVRKTPKAPATVDEYPPPPPEPLDKSMLFQILRGELEGPNGAAFFEDVLRGNQLPRMKGRLLTMRPDLNPRELTVEVPEFGAVRVVMNPSLKGTATPGAMLDFDAVIIQRYRLNPFQLEIEANPNSVRGWPAAPPADRP
jgi:hypothetical protein